MKNKEIEIRFKISEKVYKDILKDLNKNATKIYSYRLIDTYYIPNFKEFEIDEITQECVRIRQTENKNKLCYKKIHHEAKPVYCDEYETNIENKEIMEKILFALGFSVQMIIDKIRSSYKIDKFQFDLDYIKEIGYMLEVELKDENANIDQIYNFVNKYGLTKLDVTHEGIQDLMKKSIKTT